MNEIYLSTIAKGIYEFSSSQIYDIENIAYQCPDVGGPAVYKARVLYALVNDTAAYNDEFLCEGSLKHGQNENINNTTNNFDVTLYPNPANTEITLLFNSPFNNSGEIQIYNLLGEIIFEQTVSAGSTTKMINTSDLSDGIYFVRILDKGIPLFNGKFVIQK